MPLGSFETVDRRLQRLRTEIGRTIEDMGKTVAQGVDIEARRRSSFDLGMQRFREVEQRQQPTIRDTATPTVTPLPGPRGRAVPTVTPSTFDVAPFETVRGPEINFGVSPLRRDRFAGMMAAQRAGASTFGTTPEGELVIPSEVQPLALERAEQVRTRFTAPIAAAGLQLSESPIGDILPGVQTLKGITQLAEEVGVPEQVIPTPRRRTFAESFEGGIVNPIAAALGSEEEQRKAQAVLEEAGLARSLAAEVVFDLLNVVPVVGFTNAGDLVRFIVRASKATGKAREALIQSPKLRGFVRAVSDEAGGAPLRGGEGLSVPQRIHKLHNRLARDWDLERLGPAVLNPEDVAPIAKQRVIAEFGDDPTITLYRGIGPGERQPAFGIREGTGEFWSTDFNRAAGFARGGKIFRVEVKASELTNPVGTPRPVGLRATKAGDEFVLPPEITSRAAEVLPAAPLRGGEELPPNPHIAKADPGPPPREPPGPPRKPPKGPRGPSPDDPEFDQIAEVAMKGEQPEETLMRRHQAAIDTEQVAASAEVVEGNRLLKEAGLGRSFKGTRVPKVEGEFNELNSLLHNPSAVESGARTVPERLRPTYNQLRDLTDWEQAARIDFDPDMALVEDYFFRGWQPPEGMFTGEARGALGRNPKFKMPRVDASFDEMIEAGFKPLFENPVEQARYSRLLGVKYREQMKLIERIKAVELALPHEGGPITKGWRVPRVGPAFEGKPFGVLNEAGNPQVLFTRRYAVPDSLANRLENAYGVTPDLGTVTAFGKTANLTKLIDVVTFVPKRAKLIASVFQHVDFATRSQIGAWAGFVNALRHGQPLEAVEHLAVWPKTAGEMLRAVVDPSYRQTLRRLRLDTAPLFEGRDLSMRMISEAGLSTQDVTILPGIDTIAREAAQGSKVKAVLNQVADLERIHRQGLFQGMYPASILTDVKNNIAAMMLRNHPDASDLELAGMIAKAANTKYSTVQAATSVVQNRFMRGFLTRLFFSLGEQEGLLRAFTGAIRGPNAAFWREHWLGAFIGLVGAANVIHFASTGELLPLSRYSPISKTKWGPLPFGYNRDFAAPDLPLTGRSGTKVTLDLVGQMDTAFRLLDPASYLTSRASVPLRAGFNQVTGKDFFGAPIDTVGPGGILSRTSQLASDLFAPIGFGQAALQTLRDKIDGAEGVIQPGEDRLGTGATLIQSTGINLRAETTPQLLTRLRAEVMREMKLKGGYRELEPAPKEKVDRMVEERVGPELELRRQTAELRGQVSPLGQQIQAVAGAGLQVETEKLAPAAAGVLANDPQALDAYKDARTEFFTSRRAVGEAEAGRLGIEPRDREAPTEQGRLVNEYYALEPQDLNGNGFIDDDDLASYFAEQDKVLSQMTTATKGFINDPRRIFTDLNVIRVEEIRRDAIDVLRDITALPKWQGLTLEEGEKVDDLVRRVTADVQRFKAQATREGLDPDAVTFRSTTEWLEQRGEITELDALNAITISSGNAIRAQGRINLALERRQPLLIIFPNFLDSVLPVDVERAELTESEIERLEPVAAR